MADKERLQIKTLALIFSIIFFLTVTCRVINSDRQNPVTAMDELECTIYVLNEANSAFCDAITKDDLKEASVKSSILIKKAVEVAKNINNDFAEDGLCDIIPQINEIENSSDEITGYEWIFDYNLDGVKDIYDYNIWKTR